MSETTSTTSTATGARARQHQAAGQRTEGPHRRARILTGRDAITIYALIAFLIYAAIAIPRFASPGHHRLPAPGRDPGPADRHADDAHHHHRRDRPVCGQHGRAHQRLMGVLWAGGMDIWLVLAISLLAGVAAGMFNGFLIAVVGLPSLAVTIGTLALFRGLALVVIGDNAVANFPTALTAFFTSKIGAHRHPDRDDRRPRRDGLLRRAAALHALRPGTLRDGLQQGGRQLRRHQRGPSKFWLYVGSGARLRLAGVYWTLRYSSARSDNASGLELAVIAAVLLGGVSIFGGKGSIPGVIAGVLLIGTLNYALRLARVSDVVLIIVTGLLLIVSVVAPSIGSAIRRWRHDAARPPKFHPQAT